MQVILSYQCLNISGKIENYFKNSNHVNALNLLYEEEREIGEKFLKTNLLFKI